MNLRKMIILAVFVAMTLGLNAQISKVKHVILIGSDGLGAYAIPNASMPNLKGLMNAGAYSLKARSVLPSSSAVNWASMLMGAGPTFHGYTEWGSQKPEIPSIDTTGNGLFPSIFNLIRSQRLDAKTAAIYSWDGIGHLLDRKVIDFVIPTGDQDDVAIDSAVRLILEEKPLFTFVHLDQPDGVGHAIGHHTLQYFTELRKVDERIGRILQAVKDAGIEEETLIMVTSDHGGVNKGHGGKSLQEVEIPWVIYGPGVVENRQLKSHIITYDTAATLAWALGLEVPQAWRGQVILEAFVDDN